MGGKDPTRAARRGTLFAVKLELAMPEEIPYSGCYSFIKETQ
jgi:hypothetical protein